MAKKKPQERYPVRISLKIEQALADRLTELAEEEDRSLNNLIRQLLWRVLKEGDD